MPPPTDTETKPSGSPPNETCPECGAWFRCGAVAGDEGCWCHELPPVAAAASTPDDRCLCPTCLARHAGVSSGQT